VADSSPEHLVFNRTVTLRDTWAKAAQPAKAPMEKKKPAAPRDSKPRERTAQVAHSPEMEEARARFERELGIGAVEAELLTRDPAFAGLFEGTVQLGAPPKSAANWIVNVLLLELKERGINEVAFGPAQLLEVVRMVEDGTISSAAGRTVVAELTRDGGDPREIVERRGLRQVSDESALAPVVDEVVAANAAKATEYRGGKTGLMGFFVGQVMRSTGGTANPERVKELLERRLA
jgi:glutaminyl-tRNA synthetase